MIAVAFVGVGGQYFPMWGGMIFPARKGYTEEDYYFAEYSAAERDQGLHLASSAFVSLLISLPLCCWIRAFEIQFVLLSEHLRCKYCIGLLK